MCDAGNRRDALLMRLERKIDYLVEQLDNQETETTMADIFPTGEIPEEPAWVAEGTQLFLDHLVNVTPEQELAMLPENSLVFFR